MTQLQATRIDGDAAIETRPGYAVRRLESGEESRWDAFVRSSPQGTFYHLSGWRSLIENRLHHAAYYLYCEDNGQIEAVLPLVHVKSLLFGNALISVPFLVYGGPLSSSATALDKILEAARDLAVDLGVDHLELRNQDAVPGDWLGKDNYATFRKTIDPDPEKNLMAVPRKQRAMIRKGIKAGLEAEIDRDTDRLYAAMLECKRNLGTPFFGPAWLRAIKEEFEDQVEITTITHQGRTVCSVMSFRFGNEILPYYGGGGELARELNGNDFMYWAVMERACQEGIEVFDYGRSMAGSGAYRFKKHWGFEPEPLQYQYFLVKANSLPDLNPANPRYRLLISTWKKLPLPMAGMIGPPIARRLG
ncbi:MAG: FemAB family PEP-CTERM system-associated protein [Gammaproteobacteria bacterium]|nr:FemAB family PEP-CTERM system-associated protein [Gammaproteobacteria bacterium]NND46610.1 FemAB family PEP-CTERM system-associated protein [Woeseiaceae bacterium]NNL44409.1 FemAB family PEP-CTERM system-associated protein [Woeseiaceae bacterium]